MPTDARDSTEEDRPRISAALVKPGDWLTADVGFPCMPAGRVGPVEADGKCLRFLRCAAGIHWIDGQMNDAGELVGLMAVPS